MRSRGHGSRSHGSKSHRGDKPPRASRENSHETVGDPRESGQPGGAPDDVMRSVRPASIRCQRGVPKGKHLEIRTPAAWGQGERGAAGYEDSGGSELIYRDGQLLGGTTAGPGGEPTIDIHGGASQPHPEDTTELRKPTAKRRKRKK